MSGRRSSKICVVVKQLDHHCGDDIIYAVQWQTQPAAAKAGLIVNFQNRNSIILSTVQAACSELQEVAQSTSLL